MKTDTDTSWQSLAMTNLDYEKMVILLEKIRNEIIESVLREKIIVIVRGIEKENLIPLAEAMYDGGIRMIEITYSADLSISDEETAENIHLISEHFGDRMYVGAGTVLTEKQVELTKNAGGKFIISPDVNEKVIEKTRSLGLVSMPGALTPTEVQKAHSYGADFVKLFPITNMGSKYVKAISAPLSNIKMLAVGGIDENNMREYLDAGVCGFGIGSNIVDKKMISEGKFAEITKMAQKYTAVVKNG